MAPDQPTAPTPIRESAAQVCEAKAAHVRANADALKKFGDWSVDEGRCRELAALFLDEAAEQLRGHPRLERLLSDALADRIATLERTLSEREGRIAELEEESRQYSEAIQEWLGTPCGGDCLAAPCGTCDGTMQSRAGEREMLREALAEFVRIDDEDTHGLMAGDGCDVVLALEAARKALAPTAEDAPSLPTDEQRLDWLSGPDRFVGRRQQDYVRSDPCLERAVSFFRNGKRIEVDGQTLRAAIAAAMLAAAPKEPK